MKLQALAIGLMILGGLAGNFLWYRLKQLLRHRGYPAFWSHHHFQDLRHLDELIRNAGGSPEGQRLRRLRTSLYSAIAAFVAAFLLVAASRFLRT